MRFRTSFGDQVLLIGLAPVIGLTMGSVNALRGEWLWAGVGALMVGLFAWVLLAARYTIVDGVLDIRCGLCHRRVRLSEVTGLHCRTLYKGPLLGLGSDFIGIEYGDGKAVNVSPKDVDGFIDAIRAGNPPIPALAAAN